MENNTTAPDFQQLITDARIRRQNEDLAKRVFDKNRRQSDSGRFREPELAKRVGVKKRVSFSPHPHNSRAPRDGGDTPAYDSKWTHDRYDGSNSPVPDRNGGGGTRATTNQQSQKRRDNLRRALERAEEDVSVAAHLNVMSSKLAPGSSTAERPSAGFTIRGLAGPYVVMAQNFAPGTSAADIESAMMPYGGEILECRIVKTSPIMVSEMVFVSKQGADTVVDAFNGKTADGRVLRVYHKPGGYTPRDPQPLTNSSGGPRTDQTTTDNGSDYRNQIVDGSMGFYEIDVEGRRDDGEPMDEDRNNNNGGSSNINNEIGRAGSGSSNGYRNDRSRGGDRQLRNDDYHEDRRDGKGLYSDALVGRNSDDGYRPGRGHNGNGNGSGSGNARDRHGNRHGNGNRRDNW